MSLSVALLNASPWLIGWMIGHTLGRILDDRKSIHLVAAGTCSFLSFYVWSMVIWLAVNTCKFSLSTTSLCLLLTLTAFCFYQIIRIYMYSEFKLAFDNKISTVLAIAVFINIAFILYVSSSTPIFSWDFLGEWPERGYATISLEMLGRLNEECSNTYTYDHRHPPLIAAIAAWSAVTQHGTGFGGLLWWSLCSFSAAAVVAGTTASITTAPALGLLSAILLLTLPLFENQAITGGYAESLIAGAVVISTSLLVLGLRAKSLAVILLAAVVATMPIATKSSGLLYTLPILMALAVSTVLSHIKRRYAAWALAFAVVFLIAAFTTGFDLHLGRLTLSWSPSEGLLTFAGRSEALTFNTAGQIGINLVHAYFTKTSFSLSFIALAVVSIIGVRSAFANKNTHAAAPPLAFSTVVITLLLLLIATQLTNYGLSNALPDKDTGNSRFTLPLMSLVSLVPCVAWLLLSAKRK